MPEGRRLEKGKRFTLTSGPPGKHRVFDAELGVGGRRGFHPLKCRPAGVLAPEVEVAFEVSINVPRDAYGRDVLRWEVAGHLAQQVRASIELLAPRAVAADRACGECPTLASQVVCAQAA